MNLPADQSGLLSELRTALSSAEEAFSVAAECYVRGLREYPKTWAEKVAESFPNIPHSLWSNLERVGRGLLAPAAISTGQSDQRIASLCGVPLSEQERAFKQGVKVCAGKGDDHRLVPVHLLTEREFRSVVKGGRILSIEEQRKDAMEPRARRKPMNVLRTESGEEIRYAVVRNHLVINRCPVVLTAVDARRLLEELVGG